ncbi:MAG TPA: hypothetical protein ENH40_04035 [Nitrospirae bacterium]|nr:hypothetical protein [Nitrospirota bacterium]
MDDDLEKTCEFLRGQIRDIGVCILVLKKHEDFKNDQVFIGQHNEMMSNIMLSYRHLEDARMRLGKVMQQIQGGVSILDKIKEGGVNKAK